MSFKQSVSDPCTYTSNTDGLFILAVYVDDILLVGELELEEVKADLGKRFQLKDMGKQWPLERN